MVTHYSRKGKTKWRRNWTVQVAVELKFFRFRFALINQLPVLLLGRKYVGQKRETMVMHYSRKGKAKWRRSWTVQVAVELKFFRFRFAFINQLPVSVCGTETRDDGNAPVRRPFWRFFLGVNVGNNDSHDQSDRHHHHCRREKHSYSEHRTWIQQHYLVK